MRLKFPLYKVFSFFLVLTFFTPFLSAEKMSNSSETFGIAESAKISETVRYIPYQDIKQAFDGKPPCIIISRKTYEEIKAAKEAYLGRQPYSPLPMIDLDYSFGKASYKGFVKDRVGEFTFSALVDLPNDIWVMLPLPRGDVGYIDVTLDGEPIGLVFGQFSEIVDPEVFSKDVSILQQRFNSAVLKKGFGNKRSRGVAG